MLKSLYYALFESHLSYGLAIWGKTHQYLIKPIEIMQKKAIRLIAKKDYNSPTDELFINENILKLDKLYTHIVCKIIYKFIKNTIPEGISSIFKFNNEVHNYNTRNKNAPHIFVNKNTLYCQSFLLQGPRLWLRVPINLTLVNNESLFSKKLKKFLLLNEF